MRGLILICYLVSSRALAGSFCLPPEASVNVIRVRDVLPVGWKLSGIATSKDQIVLNLVLPDTSTCSLRLVHQNDPKATVRGQFFGILGSECLEYAELIAISHAIDKVFTSSPWRDCDSKKMVTSKNNWLLPVWFVMLSTFLQVTILIVATVAAFRTRL